MSSESHARNMAVESPRFPGEGSSTQGKSGPKPRTEVVGDGQQVEIPAPPRNEAVTQKDSLSRVMVNPVQAPRVECSEVRTPESLRCDADRKQVGKQASSRWREKLLVYPKAPVPETDTGGRGENPETNGRTLVKELGKIAP
jgi:hypothetical protein